MTHDYHIFTLPNGLRCVHERTGGAVSYAGIVVNAGSRDESEARQGLAHFVEHTIFKGTTHRSSWHISNRMESVGGELNAYTSKEETVIYTNAPQGYTDRAFDLLADIIACSTFPEREITKERDVVIEEINSYLDSPGDSIFDRFEEKIYSGNSLSHNILGTPESVRRLTGAETRGFIDKYYTPMNMVLYCVDGNTHARVEHLAERYFGTFHYPKPSHERVTPPVRETFCETINEEGHQAHTIMGARVCNRLDENRFPLFLLNNHLGGPCMNSLLNQELREKRGYVYTVDSTLALMSDCGIMQVYFGSDPRHVDKCRRIITRTIERLAESPMNPNLFNRIQRQYIGQLLVSSDHRESMAMSLGKSLTYYGEIHDIGETSERIAAVTPEQVRSVAEMIASRGLSSLTLC